MIYDGHEVVLGIKWQIITIKKRTRFSEIGSTANLKSQRILNRFE